MCLSLSLMINLNRNENRYGPAPKCYEILKEVDPELFISYSTYFTDEITPILSAKFNFPQEQIMLEYGGENILRLIFDNVVGLHDKVLISDYAWNFYVEQIKRRGGKKEIFKMIKHNLRYEYDMRDLIEKYKLVNPILVILTSPNNPTGNSINFLDLEKFMDITTKKTVVVLDEAYFDFQNNYDQKKLNQLILTYPNLLVLRSFSKLYALAGLRIGYALCGKEALKRLNYQKLYLGYNRLSEKIVLAALHSDLYYINVKNKLLEDRKKISEEINKIPGWRAYESEANFILVEFPVKIKEKLKLALSEKKIAVKFHEDKKLHNMLRVTIGVKEENRLFLEVIQKLSK